MRIKAEVKMSKTPSKILEYCIEYTTAADKFFQKHEEVRKKYRNAVRSLMTGHPEHVDVKKIKGAAGDFYRIRLGKYRVIYTVINGKIVVIRAIAAGSRGDIYKKL